MIIMQLVDKGKIILFSSMKYEIIYKIKLGEKSTICNIFYKHRKAHQFYFISMSSRKQLEYYKSSKRIIPGIICIINSFIWDIRMSEPRLTMMGF